MRYSPASSIDKVRAFEFLDQLFKGKKTIEIKVISPRRSLSQNAYLHLILSAYGTHFGLSLDEAKQDYKRINSGTYNYEKNGAYYYKSSADLDTAEMTATIDNFRRHSAEQGYPLPSATDKLWLEEIEKTIEQSKHYL